MGLALTLGNDLVKTLTVNLFGGPSVGKSTSASLLFGKLKNHGITAEYAPEFAKDLTWEGRKEALAFQPYIFAKQFWRIHRLVGKVEVIITDSPLLLSAVYAGEFRSSCFCSYVKECFDRFDNFNVVLKRNPEAHRWNPKGRSQTEDEAIEIDQCVRSMLRLYSVPFTEVMVEPGELTANQLVDLVVRRL